MNVFQADLQTKRNSTKHFITSSVFIVKVHLEKNLQTSTKTHIQATGSCLQTQGKMSGDENIEEAFLLYDKRGDNKIECSQVGEVLRALGINPTEYEIKKLINGIDPTGEGRVSFSEFLPMYQSLRDRHKKDRRAVDEEYFMECFRVFDRSCNGLMSAAELRHVLSSLGDRLTDEEVDNLLVGFEDNQGQVYYEDFVKTVISE